jgi:hypothetical protein
VSYKIELNGDQVDQIIIEDLQKEYKSNLEDPAFPEILDAFEVMLSYYMSPSEYDEWFQNRGRDDRESKETM